ncbi:MULTISPECIES: hypothetical protein [unclassified Moorena]|uniref:hypothetical protein n=1 Tax=unclassified Moorena TaxID=2683338 RepID=UPI0025CE20E0|nr:MULTISPECIES: hypothetical protein [unclassified Moorena]
MQSALSRLCFVLGIATLYLTAQGTKVVARGLRRFVDPHRNRCNSYLMHWLGMGINCTLLLVGSCLKP